MRTFTCFTKPLIWVVTLLMVALAAGCGGNFGGSSGSSTPSATKAISVFSLAWTTGTPSNATGVINETNKTIAVTVPYGTDVTALKATFTTTGASVKVGATVQVSGTTANNFTTPVAYVVTAADNTWATYTVVVAVSSASARAITAFSLAWTTGTPGTATGSINETLKTIAVTVPSGTDKTSLKATFAKSGSSVTVQPSGVVQTSGTTLNDFTGQVTYRVTASNALYVDYVVTVTAAASGTSATVFPGVAGSSADANATNPTVNVANPSNLDTNVPTSIHGATNVVAVKTVTATFNEAMNAGTITATGTTSASTFSLKETVSGTNVPGTVTMNTANTIATFTPTAVTLGAGVSYTATVSTAATRVASGTAMPKPVVWSFTTRATSAAHQASPFVGQAPIDLLTANNFAILSSSPTTGITETGTYASVISGDVGLSPGPATAIGVHCSEVGIYTIYGVDAGYVGAGSGFTACFKGTGADITLVNTAVGDMGTAYGNAAGRTLPDAIDVVGATADIGGLTFYPGLYKYSAATGISTNVTLDAQGDSNAVWIFQISGDLTVPSSGPLPGIQVILTNKAKASNVFWQVAASSAGVTIGTYNTFNGNILSSMQVILQTNTVLNGRALGATQVVLDANVVTKPAP